MDSMSVLIAGARGYIGAAALRRLRADGTKVLPLSSSPSEDFGWLDLGNPKSFDSISICEGDFILLMAAISSPDVCAKDPELVRRINVEGTGEFISTCITRGARVIFFSSDTVYGERTDAFDESATCNPSDDYAVMKHEVEGRFLGNTAFKTIRLSYVFSSDDKFTKYLRECVERMKEAEIFHPFYRAVVHRDDVVQGAITLAQRWDEFPQSAINFGGPNVIARTEFAQTLKETVLPVLRFRQIEPEPDFFTNRPRMIQMTSPVLVSLLGRPARTLREAARIEINL
jgi:nucleoside-diphosphate-sugar epimerase